MLLSLWLGCLGGPDDSAKVCAPALTLLSPAEGETVCGSPLAVSTEVSGFTLIPDGDYGDDVDPCAGHVHAYMNGQETATEGVEDFVFTTDGDGFWQLRVDLALANHEVLDPYVGTTIYITTDAAVCP